MSIAYLCPDCKRKVKMDGFDAVNEVGRKSCLHCGDNKDNLVVVDRGELEQAIKMDKLTIHLEAWNPKEAIDKAEEKIKETANK